MKQKKGIKLLAMLLAVLMVWTGMPPIEAKADQTMGTLGIAQYISANGTVQPAANGQPATYSGVLTADVPIAEVMKPVAPLMSVGYPWAKNGGKARVEVAYLDYTITFPAAVQLGELQVENHSGMFNANAFTMTPSADGTKAVLKLPLNQIDFPSLKRIYDKEIQNPQNYKITLKVPYTVTAADRETAAQYDAAKITGKGDFGTEQRVFFFNNNYIYNTDEANAPFTAGLADSFNANPGNPNLLPAYTPLGGDLRLDGNTTHDAVYTTTKDKTVKLTGSLDVAPVKAQMLAIEQRYAKPAEEISLDRADCEFTAEIDIPQQMDFTSGANAVLTGANNVFKITGESYVGSRGIVKMGLTNPGQITDFAKLKTAVMSVADQLEVTIDGAVFTDEAQPNVDYHITGSLTGSMEANATFNGHTIPFHFEWNAEQTDAGRNFGQAADSSAIEATLRYANIPTVTAAVPLPGDIRIGTETEHDAVYVVADKDDPIAFTGVLDVSAVKAQIEQINQQYNQHNRPGDQIEISNLKCDFVTTLTLPEGMEWGDSIDVALEGVNDKFEMVDNSGKNYEKDGNKLTIHMATAKVVNTFADLQDIVGGVDPELRVVVTGARFSASSHPNTEYEVKGTVGGSLTADAKMLPSGTQMKFDLTWDGKQKPEGADFKHLQSEDITFTLKYPEKVEPPVVTEEMELPGDILVGDETQHNEVFALDSKDHTVIFTGALDVSKIKDQIERISQAYNQGNKPAENIEISDLDCSFETTLKLPAGMRWSADVDVKLLGDNDNFTIKQSAFRRTDSTITVVLIPKKEVHTFADLQEIVSGVDNELKVVADGAEFTADSQPETNYTVEGTVSGKLSALATMKDTRTQIKFDLTWKGVQKVGGEDSTAPDSRDITFTLKYADDEIPNIDPATPSTPSNPATPSTPSNPATPSTPSNGGHSGGSHSGGSSGGGSSHSSGNGPSTVTTTPGTPAPSDHVTVINPQPAAHHSNRPVTGDAAQTMQWIVLLGAGMTALLALLAGKKRRK